MDVRIGLLRKLSAEELMLLNCGFGEESWESLGLQGDPTSPSYRKSALTIHWKDWCWSCNSNILVTWCEELTHWKRPWCWERLKAGEGDNRGWDGWMASPTQWAWVWVNSGSWWCSGRPGVLQITWWQRLIHDEQLNWTELLLGRKVMTNLESILKSKDITLSTKVHLVKAMVFPVVMYGCESWTVNKVECWRIDAFELWCWRRLLRVPWTARRSNQSILQEISPGCSLEGLMLKLKL